MAKMSIVIPVWNKSNFTKSCLKDLARLYYKTIDHEIIVVDNGSTDKTEKVVQSFIENQVVDEVMKENTPEFKYVKLDKNYGFAVACNRGFRESTGNVVMFLNNDIRVNDNHEDWAGQVYYSCIQGCGATYTGVSRPSYYLVGPTVAYIHPTTFEFKYETTDFHKRYNYMSAWCIAATRDTWDFLDTSDGEGKPFSEEFGLAFFEDTDLGFRARKEGVGFKKCDAPLTHFGHITAKQLSVSHLYRGAKKIFTKKWSKK